MLHPPCNHGPAVGTSPRLRKDRLGAFGARHAFPWLCGQLAFAEQALLLAVKATAPNEIAHAETVDASAGARGDNNDEYQKRIHSPPLESMCSA